MIVKIFASCLIAAVAASSESSSSEVAPGKGSGDLAYSFLQLRWTLRAQLDLLWEQNLPRPLRPVLGGRTPSSLRRWEQQPLRGGGRGQTRGRNAQLLSRSRPRWEREWKV